MLHAKEPRFPSLLLAIEPESRQDFQYTENRSHKWVCASLALRFYTFPLFRAPVRFSSIGSAVIFRGIYTFLFTYGGDYLCGCGNLNFVREVVALSAATSYHIAAPRSVCAPAAFAGAVNSHILTFKTSTYSLAPHGFLSDSMQCITWAFLFLSIAPCLLADQSEGTLWIYKVCGVIGIPTMIQQS